MKLDRAARLLQGRTMTGEEVKRKAIKTLHAPYHRKDKAPK